MTTKTGLTDTDKIGYLVRNLSANTIFALSMIGDCMCDGGNFSSFLQYYHDKYKEEIDKKAQESRVSCCGMNRNSDLESQDVIINID